MLFVIARPGGAWKHFYFLVSLHLVEAGTYRTFMELGIIHFAIETWVYSQGYELKKKIQKKTFAPAKSFFEIQWSVHL